MNLLLQRIKFFNVSNEGDDFCCLYEVEDTSLLTSSIIAIDVTLSWLLGTSNLFAFFTSWLFG